MRFETFENNIFHAFTKKHENCLYEKKTSWTITFFYLLIHPHPSLNVIKFPSEQRCLTF